MPTHENLIIDEHISFGSIDPINGFKHLGILFFPTDSITDIIANNLNKIVGNISKFYAWLEINCNTHIDVKLIVLDNCLFSSILYGVETWGHVSCIEKKLLDIEMKALKSILKVKISSTNDFILHELRRCNITANIKDQQFKFYKKVLALPRGGAVVSDIISLCKNASLVKYYSKLKGEKRIKESLCINVRILQRSPVNK